MTQVLNEKERHKSAVNNARFAYIAVFVAFISVCVIAVTAIMAMEKKKTGFHAIKVTQPISYFDRTYMEEGTAKARPSEPAPAPAQE
jgi:hypothetical protein